MNWKEILENVLMMATGIAIMSIFFIALINREGWIVPASVVFSLIILIIAAFRGGSGCIDIP